MPIWNKDEMRRDVARLDRNIDKMQKPYFKKMVINIIQKYYDGVKLSPKQKNVLIMALTEIQDDVKWKNKR